MFFLFFIFSPFVFIVWIFCFVYTKHFANLLFKCSFAKPQAPQLILQKHFDQNKTNLARRLGQTSPLCSLFIIGYPPPPIVKQFCKIFFAKLNFFDFFKNFCKKKQLDWFVKLFFLSKVQKFCKMQLFKDYTHSDCCFPICFANFVHLCCFVVVLE